MNTYKVVTSKTVYSYYKIEAQTAHEAVEEALITGTPYLEHTASEELESVEHRSNIDDCVVLSPSEPETER